MSLFDSMEHEMTQTQTETSKEKILGKIRSPLASECEDEALSLIRIIFTGL